MLVVGAHRDAPVMNHTKTRSNHQPKFSKDSGLQPIAHAENDLSGFQTLA
jgi:hypothetical protein